MKYLLGYTPVCILLAGGGCFLPVVHGQRRQGLFTANRQLWMTKGGGFEEETVVQCTAGETIRVAGGVPVDLYIANNDLCTLVATDGTSVQPVARSYEGHPWEASSSSDYRHLPYDCDAEKCRATLPNLALQWHYQVQTLSQELPVRDELARFLEQTTFGVTTAELDALQTQVRSGSSATQVFMKYISEQMNDIPMTSHRAFWRQRLNARQVRSNYQGDNTHPCQVGTRYRRYAFSIKDRDAILEVKPILGSTAKRLYVNDEFRTVAPGPITFASWVNGFLEVVNVPDGR